MKLFRYILLMWMILFGLMSVKAQPSPNCKSNVRSTNNATSMCSGKSLLLWYGDTSSGKKVYQWFTGIYPNLTPISGAIKPQLLVNTANTFYVRVVDTSISHTASTDTGYCFATITVNPQPSANFTFTPTTGCGRTDVQFKADSVTGNIYDWNFGDINFNQSSLVKPVHTYIPNVSGSASNYQVTLIVKNANSTCFDTVKNAITIGSGPDAKLDETGTSIYEGKVTFSDCSAGNNFSFTFTNNSSTATSFISKYILNWGDGQIDSFSSFTSTTHLYNIGLYTLKYSIRGTNGCTNTKEYYVFVGSNPAVGFGSPGNTDICTGSSLTFPITSVGSNPPGTTYVIHYTDGSNDTSFSTYPPPASVTHIFNTSSCSKVNDLGQLNSFSAKITAVNPCSSTPNVVGSIRVSLKPKIIFSSNLLIDTTCVNSSVTFNNNSNIGTIPYSSSNCNSGNIVWEIQPSSGWSIATGTLGNGVNINPNSWTSGSNAISLNFTVAGTYTIKLKGSGFNSKCGYDSLVKTICINPLPIASFSLSQSTICLGQSVTATSTASNPLCSNNTYIWTVSYVPTSGCMPTTAAYSFISGTSDTSANPQIQFDNPGVYSLSLRVKIANTDCYTDVAAKTITVKGKPNISINSPSSICQNTKIYPTANTACNVSTATYSWSFQSGSPASSTLLIPDSILMTGTGANTISLTATNDCGQTNTSTSITINPAPTLTVNPVTTSICSGQPATINLSSNLTGVKYKWTSAVTTGTATGNSNQAALTATATINDLLSNTGSIDAIVRYTITVVGATGCVGETKTVDITVKAGVSAADAGVSQILCNLSQVTLAAINPTVGTGTWTKLSGPAGETITNATQSNTTVTGLVVGDYIFKWTINGSGGSCPSSSDTVTINNRPNNTQASVGADIIKCDFTATNNTVTLAGNIASPTRSYETYKWTTTSGGTFSNANNPTATYTFNAAGNYVLIYTITNDANCPATTDTVLVKAYNPPNAGSTGVTATVCKGNNNGTITATGNVEPIVKWQYAIGTSNIWMDTALITAAINYNNLDTTKNYRVVVNSAGFADGCTSTDFSSATTITVNPTSVGGAANGTTSVCSNSNNGNVTLTGNVGTIIDWEYSTDNGTTWQAVTPVNTTATLTYNNLTTTTQYRAVVKSGVCPQANSSVAIITVNAGVGAANAGSDSVLCSAIATTLNGNVLATGTTGAWTQIGTPLATITNATQNNTTVTNLVAGNDYTFRWTVSGLFPCASTQDDVVIKVRPTVTVANAGSDILKCDYSAVNNTQQLNGNMNSSRVYETGTWNFIGAANGATLNNSNAYNAIITFANAGNYQLTWTIVNDVTTTDSACKKSVDTINIVVKEFPVAGTISGTNEICQGSNAGNLTLTGNTSSANLQWQSSLNNITYTDITSANTASYNVGAISVTTWYRVKVYQTNCSDTVYPTPFKIQVDEPSVGGNITPALSEVCTNSANLTLTLNAQTATSINWVCNIDNAGYSSFVPALTTANVSIITNPYLINTGTAVKNIVVKAVVQNGVCPADSSVSSVIKVYPNTEQANAGTDQFLCKKDTTSLAATSLASGSGKWLQVSGPNTATIASATSPTTLISNLVVGNYKFEWSVSGSTTNICPATKDTVEIFNYDTLTNTIKNSQDTLCSNQLLNLTSLQAVSGGNGVYVYQWQQSVDGISWTNTAIADTSENVTITASTTLYFRRNIISSNCNKYSNVVKVIVQPGLGNNIIAANQNVCIDVQPNLLVGQIPTGGSGVYIYQWQQKNNGVWTDIVGANNSDYQPPIYYTLIDTSFRRVVSSGFCIGDISNEVKITINPNAKALYTFTNDKLCTPAYIDTFNIKVQDFATANGSYEWYANNILIGTGLHFPGYNLINNGDTVYIKLKAISAFGCKADSFEHKFYTVKTPTVSFAKSIDKGCGPLTVNFTNTSSPLNAPTYKWNFGNGDSTTLQTPPSITFNADTSYNRHDTTYYIKLIAYTQCDTLSFTDSVTVYPKPKALFQPDTTVGCSVFHFAAFNNSLGTHNTYTWDFGDNTPLVTDTLQGYYYHNFYTSKTDTFTVKLTATNTCGVDSGAVKVVVFPNSIVPKIIVDGNNNFGCAPVQIRFVNNTVGASKFTMNFGDGSLPYLSNKNPDTVYHTFTSGGNYLVTLKAENSCTDSTVSLTLQLFNKPQALFSLASTQFCKKEIISFINNSDTALSFEWRFGDGGTSTSFSPMHQYLTAGNYVVTLIAKSTNPTGSICTDTIRKNVVIHDLPLSTFVDNAAIRNCQPYNFVGSTIQPIGNTQKWIFTDSFSNDTIQAGNVGNHIFYQVGSYDIALIVFNTFGCSDTSSTIVKVIETPKAKFVMTDTVSCAPGKFVTCINQTTYSATDGVSYQWYVNGVLIAPSTKDLTYNFSSSTNITTAVTYTIKLVAINSFGCKDSITKKFTIIPKAQPSFTINTTQGCVPLNLQFNNTSQYANIFKWYVDGNLFSNSTSPSPINLTIPATTYTIKLVADNTLGCGTDSIAKTVSTYTKPVANFQIPVKTSCTGKLTITCFDLSTVLGANIKKWYWVFGDGTNDTARNPVHTYLVAGRYTVSLMVQDDRGCSSDYTSQTVANFGKPNSNFVMGNACINNPAIPVNLSTAGFGSTAINSYLWNFGDGNFATGIQPINIYKNEGIYTVTLVTTADSSCVADTFAQQITVYGKPIANFTVSNNCVNENTLFTNSSIFGYAQTAIGTSNWSFGDGVYDNSLDASHIYKSVGDYSVRLTVTGNRCPNLVDSIRKIVTIHQPRNSVVYSRINGVRGIPIQLAALGGGTSYNWNPITGLNNTAIQNPIANYPITSPNIINYTITITDSVGCKVKDKQEVWLFVGADIFLPTAFTPNGDGANDLFKPLYINISRINYFRIYNRWGKIVFETSDLGKYWDGKLNGVLLPADTYTWIASGYSNDGKEITRKGNVTLIANQ